MNKKILHLRMTEKWFTLIALGIKKAEYRNHTMYWYRRLVDKNSLTMKVFDEVYFYNGYNKAAPFMRVECLGCKESSLLSHKPVNGEELPSFFFMIELGEILEIKNYKVQTMNGNYIDDKRNIYKAIKDLGTCTETEISQATGIMAARVDKLARAIRKEGLIEIVGSKTESGRILYTYTVK